MQTFSIIGATGLVGSEVVRSSRNSFAVHSFGRREVEVSHPNLQQHLVDFDQVDQWSNQLTGEALVSCLGTTLKKAGSKDMQYRVDVTYQLEVARAAAEQGIATYILVSSAGADSSSMFFYSRIKGELEEAVQALPFQRIIILQPSILDGKRGESRPGERIGLQLMHLLGRLPFLRKYRPIPASTVARAILNVVQQPPPDRVTTYTLDAIFALAKNTL